MNAASRWLLAFLANVYTNVLHVCRGVPTDVGDTFAVTQASTQSSCTVEVLGCFYDKKWGDCRYLHTPKPGCTGAAKAGRDIPFAPQGCFGACHPEQHECQQAPSPPPCDPKSIDLEGCATICANWQFPGANNYEVYAAMQASSVCFCGTSADGAAAIETTEETALPMSDCNSACAGNPAEKCGALGRNSIMRVSCGSAWGFSFVNIFGALSLLYVAAGVGFAAKTQGKSVALVSHPHYTQWQEVRGLVMDGIEYAKVGRAAGGSRGGARQVHASSRYGAVDQTEETRETRKQHGKSSSARTKEDHSDKKSKERRHKGAKPGKQTDAGAGGVETNLALDPTAAQHQQTSAGDGGRWVHVPN